MGLSLDDFRLFEAKGLRTLGENTHQYGFIVVPYQVYLPTDATHRCRSTKRERRRWFWSFEQKFGEGGAPLILTDAAIPDLREDPFWPCEERAAQAGRRVL
jgi:hypothetical protein